jgi:nucleotide-binding universal stress UspA family protein
MFCPTRILVPVDFTDSAMPAVVCAHDIARAFGSRVHLLHVTARPTLRGSAPMLPATDLDDGADEWRQDALDQLALLSLDWSRSDGLHGRQRTTLAVRSAADPVAAILAYAHEEGCDLIVMGTHLGPTASGVLHKSTAERVRRHATCPVVLVPPAAAQLRPAWMSDAEASLCGAAS